MNRRDFIRSSVLAGTAAQLVSKGSAKQVPPSERVTVGVLGAGARAQQLMETAKQLPGVEIVALCDAYDALTSARAFRSALTLQEARRVIERDAGTLWNPDMVRVFLKEVVTAEAATHIAER